MAEVTDLVPARPVEAARASPLASRDGEARFMKKPRRSGARASGWRHNCWSATIA
jgi:hypothetical protein